MLSFPMIISADYISFFENDNILMILRLCEEHIRDLQQVAQDFH